MTNESWGSFVDCLMSAEIQEMGIGYVVVARRKSAQTIRCVSFVVDVFCLGVKDCLFQKCSEMNYGFIKENLEEASKLIPVAPSYAKKFLDGAVAYAKEIGFDPHPDFQRYFNSLSDVDSFECKDMFSYGKDGKPLYVQGPNDSPTKVKRIMKTLEDKMGPEGFHYIVEVPAAQV